VRVARTNGGTVRKCFGDGVEPYRISHFRDYSMALPNGSQDKAKAKKYKQKYDACCKDRKRKGKGCYPKNPGSSFLGIRSDCKTKYKKWKKFEVKGGPKGKPEALSEDDFEVEVQEPPISVGTAVGGLVAMALLGVGALAVLAA